MKIVVIDGQGGRMGSAFIDKWIKSGGDPKELIAVGTNAMATSAMMKAGAVKAATGENPVVVNTSGADFVVGPIGIIAADALLGEITPKMAHAVDILYSTKGAITGKYMYVSCGWCVR